MVALPVTVAEAAVRARYQYRRAIAVVPPRLDPLDWAHRRGTLRTAEGRTLRYGDPGVARPYQDALLVDTAPRVIVAKSRQIGISQAAAFIVAVEMLNAGTVLVISRDQGAAGDFLGYVRTALLGDPEAPELVTDNAYELALANGGTAVAQPATRKAGRGTPATLVILDEQAWQDYAALIWTAVLPTLAATDGRLIVLSSVNGQGNLFHQLWQAATAGAHLAAETVGPDGARGQGAGWSWHFFPWSVHPDWRATPGWYAAQVDRLGAEAAGQEFGVDFLRSGAARFDPDDIDALWRMPALLPPEVGHRYVTAWDIARKRDATVGFTFDVSTAPFRVVAYERHLRLSYPEQARRIEARHVAYPGETWVESNGPGDPLIQFLTVPVKEFVTTALTKRNALDALLLLLQRRELIAPHLPEWKRELTLYQDNDAAISQDTIIASAIAALVAGRPVVEQRRTPTVSMRTY